MVPMVSHGQRIVTGPPQLGVRAAFGASWGGHYGMVTALLG